MGQEGTPRCSGKCDLEPPHTNCFMFCTNMWLLPANALNVAAGHEIIDAEPFFMNIFHRRQVWLTHTLESELLKEKPGDQGLSWSGSVHQLILVSPFIYNFSLSSYNKNCNFQQYTHTKLILSLCQKPNGFILDYILMSVSGGPCLTNIFFHNTKVTQNCASWHVVDLLDFLSLQVEDGKCM